MAERLPDELSLLDIVHLICGRPIGVDTQTKEEQNQLTSIGMAVWDRHLKAWKDGKSNDDKHISNNDFHPEHAKEIMIHRDDFLKFIELDFCDNRCWGDVDQEGPERRAHWEKVMNYDSCIPSDYKLIREQYLKNPFWDVENTKPRKPTDDGRDFEEMVKKAIKRLITRKPKISAKNIKIELGELIGLDAMGSMRTDPKCRKESTFEDWIRDVRPRNAGRPTQSKSK